MDPDIVGGLLRGALLQGVEPQGVYSGPPPLGATYKPPVLSGCN